jgi:hypothetical protein
VKLVREVLGTDGVAADIREVLVADEKMANELRFVGSPTIRINGRDVAGETTKAKDFALSCRLYPGSSEIGLPSVELVRQAIAEARKEIRIETRHGHFGFGCGDSEYRRDDQLLSAARFCRSAGRRSSQRIFHNAPPVTPDDVRRFDRVRILAAARRHTMQCQRAEGRTSAPLVGRGCGCRNDLVPSADRRISRGPPWRDGKMKRRTIIVGMAAILLRLVAAYFWGSSSVPQGQPPLLTLTPANFKLPSTLIPMLRG